MRPVTIPLVVMVLLALGIPSMPSHTSNDPDARALTSIIQMITDPTTGVDGARGERWVEAISWEPRAFLYHSFLSKEECEYLVELATPHMQKSTVTESTTGVILEDIWIRMGSVAHLARGHDKVIQDIEKRIADFTFVPIEHGEGLQVLHYEAGQKYGSHFDYILDRHNTWNGGQRMATVIMYLSDVAEGGETVFRGAERSWWDLPSACGKRGLSVKPKMGDALLFWSMKPDGSLDESSYHGSCPVIKGNKWTATTWLRVHEYDINAEQ